MSRVFAVTSHKGGTGRSTTTANVAFKLACRGEAVCIVDLDLASPTMGAILELNGYEAGAVKGIHDLLPRHSQGAKRVIDAPIPPNGAADLCISVGDFCNSMPVRKDLRARKGRLDLLPGKGEMNENLAEFDDMAPVLDGILEELVEMYDSVFLDVASGTDSLIYALAQLRTALTWVVFYRWTPQHLAGFARLVREIREQMGQTDVMGVRTAFIETSIYRDTSSYSWFAEQDKRLERLSRELMGDDDPTVATICRDDTLLWKEGIRPEGEFGTVCSDVIRDYETLLGRLIRC